MTVTIFFCCIIRVELNLQMDTPKQKQPVIVIVSVINSDSIMMRWWFERELFFFFLFLPTSLAKDLLLTAG